MIDSRMLARFPILIRPVGLISADAVYNAQRALKYSTLVQPHGHL